MRIIEAAFEPFRHSDTWFYVMMLVFVITCVITLNLLHQWTETKRRVMAIFTAFGVIVAIATFVCGFCLREDSFHTYQVVQEDITWKSAREKCVEKGGMLAVITSSQEFEQVIELIEKDAPELEYVWIGGECRACSEEREQKKGDLAEIRWITGEDCIGTDLWYQGEPSHRDRDGTFEPYLSLWKKAGKYAWSINDQRNDLMEEETIDPSGKIGYIIEFDK